MSEFETHPIGTMEKIAKQQARIMELEDGLREFGKHTDMCGMNHWYQPLPCNCGLDLLIRGQEK